MAGNRLNAWVAAYVANCRAHADDLLNSPLAAKVVITGDLFRPERVQSTVRAQRELPPRREGITRIVFLGQLVERKGLHVLLDAFSRLPSSCELLLAGGDWSEAGYPQQLKRIAREAGVVSRVFFENHRDDVGAVLTSADLFVLPSFSEGRPRSIIEAMSLGVPVVATAVGGIPTLITHEETGLLVPPGDAAALASALERLVRHPELGRRLGEAARARAQAECRADRTALEYIRLYRGLVAARSGISTRGSLSRVPEA